MDILFNNRLTFASRNYLDNYGAKARKWEPHVCQRLKPLAINWTFEYMDILFNNRLTFASRNYLDNSGLKPELGTACLPTAKAGGY